MADRNAAFAAADDEASIVRRIGAGDRAAFELLMRSHNQRLYRLARAALRDEAEAQDALQEAYLSAYRSIAQFRGDASLSTWLSRLVLNECLGRMRRTSRRRNVFPIGKPGSDTELAMNNVPAPDSDLPDRTLDRTQMRALIERKLDELPDTFRMIFVLRSVQELSVEDTAQSLGIPEATVRTRHFRAKSLLRESLAREIDLAERDLFEFAGSQCDGIIARVMQRV